MKSPTDLESNSSSPKRILLLLLGLVVAGSILGAVIFFVVHWRGQAQPTAQPASSPIQDCRPLTLVLGDTTFQIQDLRRAEDGSLTVPQHTSGIAYRVEGTDPNPVFVLSPTAQNLSIVSSLTLGTEATLTRFDCSASVYRVSAHEPGTFDASAQPDGSQKGLKVYFLIDASGAGFVFRAELTTELPAPVTEAAPTTSVSPTVEIPTPTSGESSLPLEISLLETTMAPDGGSIKIGVSIRNDGETAFTISPEDASLIQLDGEALPLVGSIPGLPRDVFPGDTETIDLIFPRPSTPTATLRIFTVEYEIEEY